VPGGKTRGLITGNWGSDILPKSPFFFPIPIPIPTPTPIIINSLTEKPERGACPKELLAIGLRDFREIFFKPYRILYRIIEDKIYVLLVGDGRRDMHKLLQRRLLQA
jgi:hypothetical protein